MMKTKGPCPWEGCQEIIEIEEGRYSVCPKCGGRVKGVPDKVGSGKATAGEKISFADFHKSIVQELAHLTELKINGVDISGKMDWLLGFLPASVIEETLEKAERIAREER